MESHSDSQHARAKRLPAPFVEDLQLAEIGQCTGLILGAVKVYLARAVAKIRVELEKTRNRKLERRLRGIGL
jgi:hypothetical protein